MRGFYLTVLILYLSSHIAQCSFDDELVDPMDMLNYDRVTKSMKRPITKTVSSTNQNDGCTVFLSRFINILLKTTGLLYSEDNSGKLQSYAAVTLSAQDLQLLKDMASKKEIDYIEIDRILNGMFTPTENLAGIKKTYSHMGTYFAQIKDVLYWVAIGSVSFLLLYIIFPKIYYTFSVSFILFIIITLAFASTWYTMYMKAEINRSVHLEFMPSHCYKKAGFSDWLTFSWFRASDLDECKKYKEAIHLDPKYSIALTEVFAEMFSKIMMKPLEILGQSIYIFNKAALKDFPLWAQIILIPVIIIIIIKTMLLACALLVGRHLSMKSIFGYGGTSIGPGPTNNEGFNSNNRTDNNLHPVNSAQHTVAQMPEVPNVNFNINLYHPGSNVDYINTVRGTSRERFSVNEEFKVNYNKESKLISMLKNKEIDSVDSKGINELTAKRRRHRTSSI